MPRKKTKTGFSKQNVGIIGDSCYSTSRVSPHFLSALAASCVLYNRTEHSQGFSICSIIKNLLNSPCITFNFQNKLYFQSEQQCRQHALYSHRARYNKPIRIPVRMVQIIWLALQDKSCQKCQTIKVQKPSKFTICDSLQTKIVRQVEFNAFAWSF